MSSEGNGNGNGNGNASGSRAPGRRARKAALLAAVFTVGALGGGAVVTATDAWSHWGGWGGMKGHHADPERWKERMLHRADHWLDRVDATDEQREAIGEIVGQAAGDLAGLFEQHRALHGEWMTELERPELDPEAMEALRVRTLDLADGKSREALETVLRIGSVLTAEQRSELVSKMNRHRKWHRERRRGGEG